MAAEIDRIDRRILQHLQHDARMSNADLAKAVHVSTATCYRRTQRLFQEGYIHTVRAEIVPARVYLTRRHVHAEQVSLRQRDPVALDQPDPLEPVHPCGRLCERHFPGIAGHSPRSLRCPPGR